MNLFFLFAHLVLAGAYLAMSAAFAVRGDSDAVVHLVVALACLQITGLRWQKHEGDFR